MSKKIENILNTLTWEERSELFASLQEHYDREDIKSYLNEAHQDGVDIQENFGISEDEFRALIPEMTVEYRAYLDNDDTWNTLRTCAVWDVVDRYKETSNVSAGR